MRRRNKYRVAAPEARRWNGRTYASKGEMECAQYLNTLQQAGEIVEIVDQPRLWLGVPENVYVPDFLVIPATGTPYYIDFKGIETPQFRRIRKLWAAYGRLPLHVMEKKRGRIGTRDIIPASCRTDHHAPR